MNHSDFSSTLEKVAFNLIKRAAIYLPNDVKESLSRAYAEETSEIGKTQLKAILVNIELAEKQQVPICQDTGLLTFYVKAGTGVKDLDNVEKALISATRRATKQIPLRPNAVHPFTAINSGDNIGRFVPQVHWDIVDGDCLEIAVLAKGGGSENVSAVGMLNPSEGLKGLKRFVIDTVVNAGAKPCPPTILGVGIGGGADAAIILAKKVLLKGLKETNTDPKIAKLEQELFEAANMTGIGPMGLGGKTTVLGVHIDWASRHPASFPVAVAFSCWASRHASARIYADGTIEYVSHRLASEH